MEISLAGNQANWNSLLGGSSTWLTEQGGSFLQSWEWGEILVSEGKTVERLQMVDGGIVVAQAQVVYTNLPVGWKYGFCAGGPVITYHVAHNTYQGTDNNFVSEVYQCLTNFLKEKKCIFFRFEPQQLLRGIGYVLRAQKTRDITPRATTVIDLTKSDENLLAAMHEKTRYNIRLAEKKNLRLAVGKDLNVLWALMEETAARDRFKSHHKKHYEAILHSPISHQLTLFTTEGQPAATGVWIGFGKTFTYLFGASHYPSRNLMAPHLLQWEGIKLGKKLGFVEYDFFGVAPQVPAVSGVGVCEPSGIIKQSPLETPYIYDQHHQYAGVTRFKLGFGGVPREAPGTYDLIILPIKYRVYQALRWLRRLV